MRNSKLTATIVSAAVLVACGGGTSTSSSVEPAPKSSALLRGNAATGMPIAGAPVTAKCAAGTMNSLTAADGSFSLDGTVSFPCLLEVAYSIPLIRLHSLATQSGVANISPFTELAVAGAAGTTDTTNFFQSASPDTLRSTGASVEQAAARVTQALIRDFALPIPAGFNAQTDPIRTPIGATPGNDHDSLLDQFQFVLNKSGTTLSTVARKILVTPPNAAPAPTLAPAPTPAPAPIPAPAPTPAPVFPTVTKEVVPPWVLVTAGNGNTVNTDIVIDFATDGVSDDGNKVVFSSWSSHGFGLGTKSCSFDWIYVRDIAKAQLSIGVRRFDGQPLCGYESSPSISGNGNFVLFRGMHPPYLHSGTSSFSGIYRAPVGGSYTPVSAKGIEFSFEMEGSIKVGQIIKGSRGRARADTDGNSIVFTMSNLENVPNVPNQYVSTLFTNAMLRLDKGAQLVENQNVAVSHDNTYALNNGYAVSSNGGLVVYGEANAQGRSIYKAWDMLARTDLGQLFAERAVSDPTASAALCGISADGRYVLAQHDFKVPLAPDRSAMKAAALTSQLSRYDRIEKTFTFVGVSEEQSRSRDADCDWFANGSFARQMSNDGNRVFWRSGSWFFMRDIAAQKTIKVPFKGTAYGWTISGNGQYLFIRTDITPDGTLKYSQSQVFRLGPINASDLGSTFSVGAFEDKLNLN